MAYIYKITNKLNGKSYIGQTITSIQDRMNKHYSHAKEATTGIDYAIKKYGKENFEVIQLCECDDVNLDDLERYYIAYYNTYKNGYNLTIGGQDISTKLVLDEKRVIADYKSGKTIKELAALYHCSEKPISNILHNNNIPIRHNNNVNNIMGKGKQFQQGDNTKAVLVLEKDLLFSSLAACAQWYIDQGYSKASTMELARKSLSRALNSNKKYCGFHVEYV